MMKVMKSYNPVLISIFTASWTAGMAAMMFPAIIPMVLLYNKLITNQSNPSQAIVQVKFPYPFKVILFVGMYLVVWALTGLVLLLGWSVPMNAITTIGDNNYIGIIVGCILIISGVYQFTPLKNKCIGYCESPLSFFTRRWHSGVSGAIKMGTYHGLYCLGCCWPYFLIMVALGWMNLLWMGLFAAVIFGEKMWKKGIWVARAFGVALIILGISSSLGLTAPYNSMMFMNMENDTLTEGMSRDANQLTNESKSAMSKEPTMSDRMNM
jgi:predicted metal-binding membrane protein